jgi:MtN3 and saliva related transmembrane protein
MEALWIGILGTAGTILSTVSLMPQVVKTWRTRSTADISMAWLVVALISMVVWIGYGSMIGAPAIIAVNVLLFFQCSFIFYIKLQNLRAAVAKRS